MQNPRKLTETFSVVVTKAEMKDIKAAAESQRRAVSQWARIILADAAIMSRPVQRK